MAKSRRKPRKTKPTCPKPMPLFLMESRIDSKTRNLIFEKMNASTFLKTSTTCKSIDAACKEAAKNWNNEPFRQNIFCKCSMHPLERTQTETKPLFFELDDIFPYFKMFPPNYITVYDAVNFGKALSITENFDFHTVGFVGTTPRDMRRVLTQSYWCGSKVDIICAINVPLDWRKATGLLHGVTDMVTTNNGIHKRERGTSWSWNGWKRQMIYHIDGLRNSPVTLRSPNGECAVFLELFKSPERKLFLMRSTATEKQMISITTANFAQKLAKMLGQHQIVIINMDQITVFRE